MSMLRRSTKGGRGGRAAEPYVRPLPRPLGDERRRRGNEPLRARGGKRPRGWSECEALLPRAGSARVFVTARAAGLLVCAGDGCRNGGNTLGQAVAVGRRRGRECDDDEKGGDDASRPSCSRQVSSSAHVRSVPFPRIDLPIYEGGERAGGVANCEQVAELPSGNPATWNRQKPSSSENAWSVPSSCAA
jgi:hypothetical protein